MFQFPIDWDAHFDGKTGGVAFDLRMFQFPIDWDAHFDSLFYTVLAFVVRLSCTSSAD